MFSVSLPEGFADQLAAKNKESNVYLDTLRTIASEQSTPEAEHAILDIVDRVERTLKELGVPQSDYPAPVANAIAILNWEDE